MVLQEDAENATDQTCEQRRSSRDNGNKTDTYTKTVGIYGTHNEERGFGKFVTPKTDN